MVSTTRLAVRLLQTCRCLSLLSCRGDLESPTPCWLSALSSLLKHIYKISRTRTCLTAAQSSLDAISGNIQHFKAFCHCNLALGNQVQLADAEYSKYLCVFTDAVDFLWTVVTQVQVDNLSLPCTKQCNKQLASLSGHFCDAELRWSTNKRQAYSILKIVECVDWILATDNGLHLFHITTIFCFSSRRLPSCATWRKPWFAKFFAWLFVLPRSTTLTRISRAPTSC